MATRTKIVPFMLFRAIHGAIEYHLYGAVGQNVRIRVREGDVVGNIIRESEALAYDLVVIRATERRRESGSPNHPIRGCVCSDRQEYSDRTKAASPVPGSVRCFPPSTGFFHSTGPHSRGSDRYSLYLYLSLGRTCGFECGREGPASERFGIPYTVRLRRGPVARTILKEAEPHHIVVTGNSRRLSQFLFESNPVRTGRKEPGISGSLKPGLLPVLAWETLGSVGDSAVLPFFLWRLNKQ